MSAEDEINFLAAAAMVRAGCVILGVTREAFFLGGSVILKVHQMAMREAMRRRKIPFSVQEHLLGYGVISGPVEDPFFQGAVNFYVDQGRTVL
jgi:hypothetical protein